MNYIESEQFTFFDIAPKIPSMQSFGDKLRAHREAMGVSTYSVKDYGITPSNLISVEKGRRPPSDAMLENLASIPEMRITVNELRAWRLLDIAGNPETIRLAYEELQKEEAQDNAS